MNRLYGCSRYMVNNSAFGQMTFSIEKCEGTYRVTDLESQAYHATLTLDIWRTEITRTHSKQAYPMKNNEVEKTKNYEMK